MKTNKLILFLFCLLPFSFNYAENKNSDRLYQDWFEEIKNSCDKDNGNLWGINLYAPLLCIDSERNIWSNQADKENNLYFDNGIYKGKFPGTHNIANSITQVFGQKWVTIMLPFPEDKIERIALACHEMFHYWQDSLHLVPSHYNYNNQHLDLLEARVLLKLEWNALFQACITTDSEKRNQHIQNGISFRLYRRKKFPQYIKDETAFEIHEGLPQYTGIKLATQTDSCYLKTLEKHLAIYMSKEELVRTFAYMSGELYGYLLDQANKKWRKNIHGDTDLGNLLKRLYPISIPDHLEIYCKQQQTCYPIDSINLFEQKRDSLKSIQKEELIRIFSKDTKILPLINMQIKFNPNLVIPLNNLGTVYKEIRIVDQWGILETRNNGFILISNDWKSIILPFYNQVIQNGEELETPYWILQKKRQE